MQTKLSHIFTISILTAAVSLIAGSLSAQPVLAPALTEMIEQASADSLIDVVILMNDDDRQLALADSFRDKKMTRAERLKQVTTRLRNSSTFEGRQVEAFLNSHARGAYNRFWIVPAFSATLTAEEIETLAQFDGVSLIAPDATVSYDPPVATSMASAATEAVSTQLQKLHVPELWAQGLTGKGRLVCSFDTGVEETHPALSSKWVGHETGLTTGWFSTLKPESNPYDAVGHGTHTMGIMVGSLDADSFGVAPEAQWMAAGVVDQGKTLGGTFSDILAAFEWVLNPDGDWKSTDDVPDVILNSWGVPKGLFQPCDDVFWGAIDNVEAAGIVTIFAAGNEGPNPMTIRNPADRASSPFNTFCVGAVDDNLVAAAFSSRGPSSCSPTDIKPEVMAPGVGIRSSSKDGGFVVMSGTSMAAPYVAGLVALAREYNPDATVEQIKQALMLSALDLGVAGEDNSYGHGFVDAVAMINRLPEPVVRGYQISEIAEMTGLDIVPGAEVSLRLIVSNIAGVDSSFYGRIVDPQVEGIYVLTNRAPFIITGDSTMAINISPFVLAFDPTIPNGYVINTPFIIESNDGVSRDTLQFVLKIGQTPDGTIADYHEGSLGLSVTDFGPLGLAEGSIFDAGGVGFRYNGSDNLLYEAGIIVGQQGYEISSSLRNADGSFRPSDFSPVNSLIVGGLTTDGGRRMTASFSDQTNPYALPVRINLTTVDYSENLGEDLVLMNYEIRNTSSDPLDSVYFGFEADFDLLGLSETVQYVDTLNLLYQVSPEGPVVGVLMLENIASASVVVNGSSKAGLSKDDFMTLLTRTQFRLETQASDDIYFVLGSKCLSLGPNGSAVVTIALLAADDLEGLKQTAALALATHGSDDGEITNLPANFELDQNYPNPFNPSTTIAFTLNTTLQVRIDVINILGQSVKQFDLGRLPSGHHALVWSGDDDSGERVASGVYFYRLSDGQAAVTRKMILLQ